MQGTTRQFDEKAIFLMALDLSSDDRQAFLSGACPEPAQRARIAALLQHHETRTSDPQSPAEAVTDRPLPCERVDEFRLIRELGAGGMGVVYLAHDMFLERDVALKVLSPSLVGSDRALARFRDEARNAANLKHPGIVPVYRFGFDGTRHYIVSEYIAGPTLAELIDQERAARRAGGRAEDVRLWHRRCAEIVAVVADALEEAHRNNIVHRDVKPSNILIDVDQNPRLTDFGIAKQLAAGAAETITGVVGSCYYMSPEQASIEATVVDHRSDIFSLGVVLYELVALAKPFGGDTVQNVLQAVIRDTPKPLRSVDRQVSRELQTICAKALEKRPADRYQTAAHFSADLRCLTAGRPILARPLPLTLQLGRWARQRMAPLTISALALVILVGAYAGWRREQLRNATFTLENGPAGAEVVARRFSDETLEPGAAQALGRLPLALQLLPPGHYRIEIMADGGMRELDVLLPAANAETVVDLADVSPRAPDRSNMIRVPAGSYTIGWAEGTSFDRLRQVQVNEFLIDATEVTNAEYERFVDLAGHRLPHHWGEFGYDAALADHPITGISWEDMNAFARWCGKRLPTAVEWEVAGRYPDARPLPWGAEPTVVSCEATVDDFHAESEARWDLSYALYCQRTAPVAAHPEAQSTLGIHDLFGNVSEVTGSVVTAPALMVLIKGGSWMDEPARWPLARAAAYPISGSSLRNGFRCAISAQPAPPPSPAGAPE